MEYILIEAENNLPNLELMTLSPISHYLNNQRCSLLSPSSSYTFFNKKKHEILSPPYIMSMLKISRLISLQASITVNKLLLLNF